MGVKRNKVSFERNRLDVTQPIDEQEATPQQETKIDKEKERLSLILQGSTKEELIELLMKMDYKTILSALFGESLANDKPFISKKTQVSPGGMVSLSAFFNEEDMNFYNEQKKKHHKKNTGEILESLTLDLDEKINKGTIKLEDIESEVSEVNLAIHDRTFDKKTTFRVNENSKMDIVVMSNKIGLEYSHSALPWVLSLLAKKGRIEVK